MSSESSDASDRAALQRAAVEAAAAAEDIRARAASALRRGEFDLAERAIARGEATWPQLIENMRIYQAELQMQADELAASQQRTQRALTRFSLLFESLPVPALLLDTDGMVLECNERAADVFGVASNILQANLFHRLVHPDDYQAEVRSAMVDACESGFAQVDAVRLRGRAAQMVADVHWRRLHDEGQMQLACVIIDRTEQISQFDSLQASVAQLKAREKENAFLADIAARVPRIVIVTDGERRVTWVNENFEQTTGYTLDDMRGKNPGAVLQGPGTDADTVLYMRQHLRNGNGFKGVEIMNIRRDGSRYWTEMEVLPVRDASGSVVQFISLQSDITARRGS